MRIKKWNHSLNQQGIPIVTLDDDNRVFCGTSLNAFEKHVYSQHGEDGITQELLTRVGSGSPKFIEFGMGNSFCSNTAFLATAYGWHGMWIEFVPEYAQALKQQIAATPDAAGLIDVVEKRLTIDNIDDELSVIGNGDIGVVSIDVDSNDYWLWKAMSIVRPRIVIIEYNASWGWEKSKSVIYDPNLEWQHNVYHGASLVALNKLAQEKGYALVCCDSHGLNAFFVRRDVLGNLQEIQSKHAFYPHHTRSRELTVEQQIEQCETFKWADI